MGNLILSHSVTKNLPFSVTAQLSELPEIAQVEFLDEFNRRSKSTLLAYVLLFFVGGTHYIYLEKWIHQILYFFTAGGFGVWWLIDLIRMPKLIREYNQQVADEVLRNVLIKYKFYRRDENTFIHGGLGRTPEVPAPPKPRYFEVMYDPTNLVVYNLKTGYLVDYDLKSWQVVSENQYDWENGISEKEIRLVGGMESILVYFKKEDVSSASVLVAQPVSVHALGTHLEHEILTQRRPSNIITYNGVTYYREVQKDGLRFDLSQNEKPERMVSWDYFDGRREFHIKIFQTGRSEFYASLGKVVSQYEFSEILPK